MTLRLEPGFGRDLLYRLLHGSDIEFLRSSATGADQMPVLALVEASFETCPAVAEIDLPGQAALREKPQGPVNGRETYPGILLPDHAVQLIGRYMPGGGKKRIEN